MPARPTLRCLSDDINIDWDTASDRDAALTGNPRKPLHDLAHPIIRKAAADFPADAGDSEVARESISGLSNPVWWKVKTGSRWRGAVYEDPTTGQAWLCAAGYRREGEGSDFYKQFMAEIKAKGATAFLPANEDLNRLAAEEKESLLDEWSIAVRDCSIEAARRAKSEGVGKFDITHPRLTDVCIASCKVEYLSEEIDGEVWIDLAVTVACLNYEHLPLVQWVELVVMAAIDRREQAWASLPVGGESVASQMLSGREALEVEQSWSEPLRPGEVILGESAHFAHRDRLTQSTVDGEAVLGLCGRWFVPRQDHEALPRCPHCDAVYRALPE